MILFRDVVGILSVLLFVSSCGRNNGVAKVRFEAVSNSNRVDRIGRNVAANSQEMNLPKNYCYFIHVQGDDYYLKKDNKAKTCNVEGPLGIALMVGRTGGMDRLRNGVPPEKVQVFSPASYGDTLALEIKTSGAERTFDIIGFDPKIFGLNATDLSPCSGELTLKFTDGLANNDTQVTYRYGDKDRPEPTDKSADSFHFMARGSAVLNTSGDTVIPMVTKEDAKGVYPKYDGACPSNTDTTVPVVSREDLEIFEPFELYASAGSGDNLSTSTGVVRTPLSISCGSATSVSGWFVPGDYLDSDTTTVTDTGTPSFNVACTGGLATTPAQTFFNQAIYTQTATYDFNKARAAKLILKSYKDGQVIGSIGSASLPALIQFGSRYMPVRKNSHNNTGAISPSDSPIYTAVPNSMGVFGSARFVGFDEATGSGEDGKRRLVVALTNGDSTTSVNGYDIQIFQDKNSITADNGPFDFVGSGGSLHEISGDQGLPDLLPALLRWGSGVGGGFGFLGVYLPLPMASPPTPYNFDAIDYYYNTQHYGSNTYGPGLPADTALLAAVGGSSGKSLGISAFSHGMWALAGDGLDAGAIYRYPTLIVPELDSNNGKAKSVFHSISFSSGDLGSGGYVVTRLKVVNEAGLLPVAMLILSPPGGGAGKLAVVRCSNLQCTSLEKYVFSNANVVDAEPLVVNSEVHMMILTSGPGLIDWKVPNTAGTAPSVVNSKTLNGQSTDSSNVALFSPGPSGFKPRFIRALDLSSKELLIGGSFETSLKGPALLRSQDLGASWLQVHTEISDPSLTSVPYFSDAIPVTNYESYPDANNNLVKYPVPAFSVIRRFNDGYQILGQDHTGY